MSKFRYTAKEVSTGRTLQGVSEAQDEKALVELLRKQSLVIISIKEDKARAAGAGGWRLRKKVKLSELLMFTRQLSTMIDSGIPLVQAIEMLVEQIEDPYFRTVVVEIKKDLTSGSSFYESLIKHPGAFSVFFVNMVRAGESSGALDDILERLALYLEKSDSLVRKVRSATIYPMVVTTMAIAITLLMLLKVVPIFKSIFADLGGKLPLPTQVLISVSDALIHSFFIWVGCAVAAIFALKKFLRTPAGTLMLDRFKLSMPVFGPIMRKVAISKFTRTLSTLIKSGVPILNALEIVSKTSGNKIIEGATEKVRESIRGGESISDPLMKSKVFPIMVVRMIAVGEKTGELEKMLTKIADFYDDQVDASVSGLTSIIEPLIIAFLGVVIGGIVICMFLPIFKLTTLINAS